MDTPQPLVAERISTFEDFISPMPADEFLKDIFGRRPLYLKGSADRFTYLLTWNALNSLLARHTADGLSIQVAKDGRVVPMEKYVRRVSMEFLGPHRQLDASELTKHLQEGATLMLDLYRDMHEPIRALADVLESVLSSRLHTYVFAGWHSTRSFDVHWDPTDIFVLQIQGKKHWRLLEPTRRHPIYEDRQLKLQPPSNPYWEGDLEPGDLLHVPRGWWHDVTPYAGPSLHVTFIIKPATGLDVVELVMGRLKQLECIRANAPRYATEAEQLEYMEMFRSALNSTLAGTPLKAFLAEFDSKIPSKGYLSLPWSAVPESQCLPESALLEWCPVRPVARTYSDGGLTLKAGDTSFVVSKSVETVLVDLINQRACSLGSLCQRHPEVNVTDCILQLISTGLVRVVTSEGESTGVCDLPHPELAGQSQ